MSEEEIIQGIDDIKHHFFKDIKEQYYIEYINGLSDLYNKEKEKNKELTDLVEAIEEFKRLKRPVMDLVHEMQKFEDEFISKDKIKEIIKQLEKEQEQNKKELTRGIDYLSNVMIEAASKKIRINLSIREYLQELLEERN